MPCVIRTPKIVSHRGGAFLWPENSLLAFRESLRLPVDQIECDVHLSADGEVVVMHDPTLDRMTDATGPVVSRTLAELRRIRVRGTGGEPVPSLAELAALLRTGSALLRLEVKPGADGRPYRGIVERALSVLDAAGMRTRTVFISFEAPAVAAALAAGGIAGTAWLVAPRTLRDLGVAGVLAVAGRYGFGEVDVPEAAADTDVMREVQAAGLALGVWGANHEVSIRRALGIGVDVIATDDPPLAIRLRG